MRVSFLYTFRTLLIGVFLFFPSISFAAYFISNNETGGDCEAIGVWNPDTQTCTLLQNVSDSIEITSNVTLDGGGFTITGHGNDTGISISNERNSTVQNLTVTNFTEGIYLRNTNDITIDNVHLKNNSMGVRLNRVNGTNIKKSEIDTNTTGIYIAYSTDTTVTESVIQNSGMYGINFNWTNHLTLSKNKFKNNASHLFFLGIDEQPETYTNHNIDQTNEVDGKTLYYFANASNITLDESDTVGLLICAECENVSVHGAIFAKNDTQAFFYNSNNVSILGSTFPITNRSIHLINTTNARIQGNTFKNAQTDSLADTAIIAEKNSNSVVIQENTFKNISAALSTRDSKTIRVIKNTVSSVLSGLQLTNAPNTEISENIFENIGNSALFIESSDNLTITKNTIHISEALNQLNKESIDIHASDGSTFSENNIQRGNISFENITNSKVEKNTFTHKNEEGEMYENRFFLYKSEGDIFSQNTFHTVMLQDAHRNTFTQNNFLSPSQNQTMIFVATNTDNIFSTEEGGGNYWSFYDEESEGCFDYRDQNGNNTSDGVCDDPLHFFINNTILVATDEKPWTQENGWENQVEPCCSSVAFLPGIAGSRLYKQHTLDEDRLWEPNSGEDVRDLYLNDDGTSKEAYVYTRDIIDNGTFAGISLEDVYQDFTDSMNGLKEDGIINNWKPLPYDWRFSVDTIARDPIFFENYTKTLVSDVEELARASKTGKVTVVAHSMGGLVAKQLITELEQTGNAHLVDRLVMIGTPQEGTPGAIASVLHGEEMPISEVLFGKSTLRTLVENMLSVYELLPFSIYFDNNSIGPIVHFDEDVKNIYDFRKIYGESIDTYQEFKEFLLGDNGKRTEPENSDIDSPNVLDENLLAESESVQNTLTNWTPPEGVEIIQVGGVGLSTVSGIHYDDCDVPFCANDLDNLDREIIFTQNGDGTVVTPSAISMSAGKHTQKYYADLYNYNKDNKTTYQHRNFSGMPPVTTLLANILEGNEETPPYIVKESPSIQNKTLRLRMHSPVAVHLYDEEGNHTGTIPNPDPNSDLTLYEENIPNSYYEEFGETKYLGTQDEGGITVNLHGEDSGTFTLELDEVLGETITDTTTFANIPVTKSAKATLKISEETGISEMNLDIDGDGETDETIQPNEKISPEASLAILKQAIQDLNTHKKTKKILKRYVTFTERILNHKRIPQRIKTRFTDRILQRMQHTITRFSKKRMPKKYRISKDEAKKFNEMIEVIRREVRE